jgi:hypothetical protein
MARPRVADGGVGLQTRKVAANVLNKHSWAAEKGWSSSDGLTTPHRKKTVYYKMLHRALELDDCFEHGNEPSCSIKGGEFLACLSEY